MSADLIWPSEWRDIEAVGSSDDYVRLYLSTPAPPEVIRLTQAAFDRLRDRRVYPHIRIRRDHHDRYWTIDGAIVEFIKEDDIHAAQ